jgi:HK97 family phage prohead protease
VLGGEEDVAMKANPESEQLICGVEYKFVDENKGIVEGYASVFDNEDLNREVVEHGAFKKTIGERVNRGVVPFLDSHQWNIAHTLGSIVSASEDSKGLHYRAQLSNAPSVQDARIKMLEGHIKLNSIGHKVIVDKFVRNAETKAIRRHLHEVKLLEISALPVAANELANIVGVKSVVPFEDLPIAPRETAWDGAAAFKRVVEWAGGVYVDGNLDESKINWTRFRRAFVSVDPENPDQATAYKMPIADVMSGDLVAVPSAIRAAARATDASADALAHLDRYLEKMETKAGDEPYGDVAYADPGYQSDGQKRYPIDTAEHVRAAWSYINKGTDSDKYSATQLASIKSRIEAAAKKFGIDISKKSVDALIVEARELGVYDVSQIRDAAFGLLGILTPAERKQILDEFSAGPGNTTHGSERDARLARLKRRSVLLNSEITQRRIS